MFARLRYLLAAFDRGEFCEAGLSARLGVYADRAAAVARPSRKVTVAGMPVVWGEP